VQETFEIITCVRCAVRFALHAGHISTRRADHRWFYCPNQHKMHYPEKTETEIEKLKKKVKDLEATIQELITQKNELQTEKSELQAANGNLEQIVDVFHRKVDVLQQRLQDVSAADCQ